MKTSCFLLIAATASWGQFSNNQSLNGKYFFRQVMLLTDGSTSPNVKTTMSASGSIIFDGNGNFTISGQQLVGTTPSASLSGSGTYTVGAGGCTTLTNPLQSGVTL